MSTCARAMLPVTFRFLIAMIAYATDERMARKLDCVQEDVGALKEALLNATGKKRIAFTAEQRQRQAIKGKAVTPDEREGCCRLVQPTTILKSFRDLRRSRRRFLAPRNPSLVLKPTAGAFAITERAGPSVLECKLARSPGPTRQLLIAAKPPAADALGVQQ